MYVHVPICTARTTSQSRQGNEALIAHRTKEDNEFTQHVAATEPVLACMTAEMSALLLLSWEWGVGSAANDDEMTTTMMTTTSTPTPTPTTPP
jgi:hypothetical protein